MARIAHMYYDAGKSMQEIVARFGLSRFAVSRLLAQARAEAIVMIKITVPFENEFQLVTRDDSSSAHDLASVIMKDPALTARVLRIVNSAYYGLGAAARSVPFHNRS